MLPVLVLAAFVGMAASIFHSSFQRGVGLVEGRLIIESIGLFRSFFFFIRLSLCCLAWL
jgi:hypothetical protein